MIPRAQGWGPGFLLTPKTVTVRTLCYVHQVFVLFRVNLFQMKFPLSWDLDPTSRVLEPVAESHCGVRMRLNSQLVGNAP